MALLADLELQRCNYTDAGSRPGRAIRGREKILAELSIKCNGIDMYVGIRARSITNLPTKIGGFAWASTIRVWRKRKQIKESIIT